MMSEAPKFPPTTQVLGDWNYVTWDSLGQRLKGAMVRMSRKAVITHVTQGKVD